jgi:hypothetical protein
MRHLMLSVALIAALASGCAMEADDETLATDDQELAVGTLDVPAYTINVNSDDGGIQITTNLGTTICYYGCSYEIAQGTAVSLRVLRPNNNIDCMKFRNWTGLCSGTSTTCNFTVTGAGTASARWISTVPTGCRPR